MGLARAARPGPERLLSGQRHVREGDLGTGPLPEPLGSRDCSASGHKAVWLSPAASPSGENGAACPPPSRGPAVASLGSNRPTKLSRLELVRRTEQPLPGSGRERRQRRHGNAAKWRRLKLLMLRVSRHEHFSRLSCLPEGFRGGLLYFMKMETTEQVKSQAGWF